jgi:hypothetical protein
MEQITEAQLADAMLIENNSERKAAEERYYASVAECDFSYCMHYDMRMRRCPLRICAYDVKELQTEPDEWDEDFEWEE